MKTPRTHDYSAKAAAFVDTNISKISRAIDTFGQQLQSAEDAADGANRFGPYAAHQLEKVRGRLDTLDGDVLVAQAKDKMEQYPKALTVAGAIAGAAIVRFAIMAVRNERNAGRNSQQVATALKTPNPNAAELSV